MDAERGRAPPPPVAGFSARPPAVAGRGTGSDVERLPAPATVLLVRVVELEALVEALAHEVELRAVEVGEALRVDEHLHAVRLELEVALLRLVGELELVGHARAAGGLHPEAKADALAPLGDVALHVLRRAVGERDGHFSPPPSSRGPRPRRTSC